MTPSPPGSAAPTHRPAGAGASERIRRLWDRLSPLPGGRWLFSKMIGWTAPYTGTIGARVEEIGAGHARLVLRDRRRVRNHLRSVHAVALTNLAEEASGLAMIYAMPAELRGILTHLEVDYLKKARGTLTAHGRAPVPGSDERREYEVTVDIENTAGEIVAHGRAIWLVGP